MNKGFMYLEMISPAEIGESEKDLIVNGCKYVLWFSRPDTRFGCGVCERCVFYGEMPEEYEGLYDDTMEGFDWMKEQYEAKYK